MARTPRQANLQSEIHNLQLGLKSSITIIEGVMSRKNGQKDADPATAYTADIPEEYVLSEEVRWLRTEDLNLFRYIRDAMNKIQVAFVSTYPPTECGIATFTKDLLMSIAKYTPFSRPIVVAVRGAEEIEPYDRSVKQQIYRNDRQSYLNAADFLNASDVDVVNIQHEYGIYGGEDGEYVLDFVARLKKPVAVTLHTVLMEPSKNQKRIMQELGKLTDVLVVMVRTGRQILLDRYGIDPTKVTVIAHGVPNVHRASASVVKRALAIQDRKVISTFGLINRGKGIEYAIEAMAEVKRKYPNVLYLVLGETHPGVRAYEGESYRNHLLDLVAKLDLTHHVRFNNRFLALNELVRYLCATDVYLTPYLNKDQIVSGTLAYAVGCGRAIVSTPYLYAEEVLGDGRGVLVDFRSADAIAKSLIELLDNPQVRERYEAAAYRYGRRTAWFNVAVDYLDMYRKAQLRREARTAAEVAPEAREGVGARE